MDEENKYSVSLKSKDGREELFFPVATISTEKIYDSTYSTTVEGRSYYRGDGIETIDVQEAVNKYLLGWGVEPDAAFRISTACKYIPRAGKKAGESSESDIEKASTYFYRALCGNWPAK